MYAPCSESELGSLKWVLDRTVNSREFSLAIIFVVIFSFAYLGSYCVV